MSRPSFAAVLLWTVLVGCQSSPLPEDLEQSSAETALDNETTAPPSSSMQATTAPLPTDEAAGDEDTPDESAATIELDSTLLSVDEYPKPNGISVSDLALGRDLVVYSGFAEQSDTSVIGVLGSNEKETSMSDVFPTADFVPVITDVVFFQDAFYASLLGPLRPQEFGTPTIIRSEDGSQWSSDNLAVVPTPEDWSVGAVEPLPGTTGVSSARVSGDRIVLTGWAEDENGAVRGAVWDSTDGLSWRLELLPLVGQGNETAVTSAGSGPAMIVRVRQTDGVDVRLVRWTRNEDWLTLEPPRGFVGFASPIGMTGETVYLLGQGVAGLQLWSAGRDGVWRSATFDTQASVDTFWGLDTSDGSDPIVFQNYASIFGSDEVLALEVWTLDRGRWSSATIPGEIVVSVEQNHIATQAATTVFIHRRDDAN